MAQLRVQVQGLPDSDDEERAELASRLRDEMLQQGVEEVAHPEVPAPEGAKGTAIEWAELVVGLAGTLGPLLGANYVSLHDARVSIAAGFRDDMERARRLEPTRRAPGTIQFMLPDAAWARRASGTLANDLAKAHEGNALAIISPKADGGYLVSIRVPRDCATSAESFCRRFPTGGGRKAAAGINHLPAEELETFSRAFEEQFRAG